jgi:hypothetical protein
MFGDGSILQKRNGTCPEPMVLALSLWDRSLMFLIEARRTSRKVNMSLRLCGNLNDEPTLARPVASNSFIRRRYASRVLFSVPHFCHQRPFLPHGPCQPSLNAWSMQVYLTMLILSRQHSARFRDDLWTSSSRREASRWITNPRRDVETTSSYS